MSERERELMRERAREGEREREREKVSKLRKGRERVKKDVHPFRGIHSAFLSHSLEVPVLRRVPVPVRNLPLNPQHLLSNVLRRHPVLVLHEKRSGALVG